MEKNRISSSKMISDNKNHRVILSLKFERLKYFFFCNQLSLIQSYWLSCY